MQLWKECKPAFVYFVIAIISLVIMYLVTLGREDELFEKFFKFILILIFIFIGTWLITFTCYRIHDTVAWFLLIIFYTLQFVYYYK